jgi:predicted lysophospholipase L1 biosynthesis ABC-type transport system permease subunit
VVEGRAPTAAGEMLLGIKTAGALRARVGSIVTARIGTHAARYRVVGRGVLPDLGVAGAATLSLGRGVATTHQGLRRLDPRALRNILLMRVAAGADRRQTLARLGRTASAAAPRRPPEIGNWGQVDGFPYALAAVVASVAAAVLAHALVTSIGRRRRDLAIFKTLGFERRQVRAVVAWQATTVAAIGLVIGLPLGIAIGRFAWNLLAAQLGVVSDPVVPVVPTILVVAGAVVIANLIALAPGWSAARTRPALVLRAE